MANDSINVALIGTKFMGKAHSNALRKLDMFFDMPKKTVMKVLCGRNKEETQASADRYGWEEASTDWKEVVHRDDIDVIDIATPGNLHAPMAIEAAKAGKHIICEKPLANTVKDAEAMLKAAQKAKVKHMCGFSYRFVPAINTIRKMIRDGELGELFHYRSAYQQDWIVDPEFPLVWRMKKKETGSGALGDIGAHSVDMCRYLVGDLSEVTATMQTFIKKRPITEQGGGITKESDKQKSSGKMGTVDVDDAALFIGHIRNADTLASFEATRFATGRRNYNHIEIYGSKGGVYWNQEDMNVFHFYSRGDKPHEQGFRRIHATDGAHPYSANWWPSAHIIGYEHLFVHEFYEFLRNLDNKEVTYPTFEDGVACQRVLQAVEKSSKSRKWEKVK